MKIQDVRNIIEKNNQACIKYVRVGNDFRFALTDGPIYHSDLVGQDEVVTSAGFFIILIDRVHVMSTASTSLKLGPKLEDEKLLHDLFYKME